MGRPAKLRLEPLARLRASIEQHLCYVEEHSAGYIKLIRGAGTDPEVQAIVSAPSTGSSSARSPRCR